MRPGGEVRGKTDIPTCCQWLHHHINLNLKAELQRLKWGGKSKERERNRKRDIRQEIKKRGEQEQRDEGRELAR